MPKTPIWKRGSLRSRAAALFGAIIIIGGGAVYVVNGGGGGGGGGTLGGVSSANLWITAPSDSSSGQTCTRSAPVSYATALAGNRTCGNYSGQFLDNAVGAASFGDTIGVPGGKYTGTKQIITFESRLQNQGCDPLGTWGAVNTTNCIRFAPQSGQQVFFTFEMENHSSDIWIDGSATGTVVDRLSRTYSFKMWNINTEIDPGDTAGGVAIDHNTYTGIWGAQMYMGGCQHCRYSQGQIGPRISILRVSMGSACTVGNPNLTADGTNGTSWPVNPSDATSLGATAPVTGYTAGGQLPSFEGRNGANLQNDVVDHFYFWYANNTADLACDPHDGGFFLRGGISSLTIADNIFNQNESYDIQVQTVGDQPSNNNGVIIENNWFGDRVKDMRSATAGSAGCPDGKPPDQTSCHGTTGAVTADGAAIDVDADTANWIVRYNSFSDTAELKFDFTSNGSGSGNATTNWQVYGNTGLVPSTNSGNPSCTSKSGVTYTKNVWVGGTCGASDTSVSVGALYQNNTISGQNYLLKGAAGSTSADNFVSGAGTTAPSNSIDGTSVGSSPWDAGSQQR